MQDIKYSFQISTISKVPHQEFSDLFLANKISSILLMKNLEVYVG